jgi:hypothetical protein
LAEDVALLPDLYFNTNVDECCLKLAASEMNIITAERCLLIKYTTGKAGVCQTRDFLDSVLSKRTALRADSRRQEVATFVSDEELSAEPRTCLYSFLPDPVQSISQ